MSSLLALAGQQLPQPDPYDYTNQYNMVLSKKDEAKFMKWAAGQTKKGKDPLNDLYDYDVRGFWKNEKGKRDTSGHAPDTYKKPNHPTFSDESVYRGSLFPVGNRRALGGTWSPDGTVFTAGPANIKVHGLDGLTQFFLANEPGVQLKTPPPTPFSSPYVEADR